MNEPFAVILAGKIMQDFSYKLGDLLSQYPHEAHVFCMNVMRSTYYAMEQTLDETDRKLLDHMKDRTTCIILPGALDPRKQEGGEQS